MGSPNTSLRSGLSSLNVPISTFHHRNEHEMKARITTSKNDFFNKTKVVQDSATHDGFPIQALGSHIRSSLQKCSSLRLNPPNLKGKLQQMKANEPSEMEKTLLRQLEYLQEEKRLDVEELQIKIERKDAEIEKLETKIATQESTIKELQQKVADLRRRLSRSSKHSTS